MSSKFFGNKNVKQAPTKGKGGKSNNKGKGANNKLEK